MGFFSGIGKLVKKVLPIAAIAAPFIPGVGPMISAGLGAAGKLFGGSSSSPAPEVQSDVAQVGQTPSGNAVMPPQQVNGSKPFDWSGALGAVATVGSGLIGQQGQAATNASNVAMAEKQMAFQAQQTGSSYQRGVADMQAAGLNPMLAYSQGGASSGSGATAQMGNELGAGMSSALQSAQTLLQLKNLSAQTENTESATAVNDARVNEIVQSTHTSSASAARLKQDLDRYALEMEGQRLGNKLKEGTLGSDISIARSEASRRESESVLSRLKQAGARNESSFEESPVGKSSRYIQFGSDTISNAAGIARSLRNPNKRSMSRTSETIKDLEGGGSFTRERVQHR